VVPSPPDGVIGAMPVDDGNVENCGSGPYRDSSFLCLIPEVLLPDSEIVPSEKGLRKRSRRLRSGGGLRRRPAVGTGGGASKSSFSSIIGVCGAWS